MKYCFLLFANATIPVSLHAEADQNPSNFAFKIPPGMGSYGYLAICAAAMKRLQEVRMRPRAIRKDAMVRGTDGLLRVEMVEAGREYVLDPFAELIWELSDGSRTVETLAQGAAQTCKRPVHREEVFSALDFLADAGLIEERVAPPVAEANVSRRALLAQIAPVVGAAAWMMSGISAKAGGLIQYNESNSKESNSKADAREANTKADNREASNKESDRKAQDRASSGKRDWDKQQDAEKGRKRDLQKTFDRINESESKRATLRQKMRTSWPKVYDVVGHKLSEFPELLDKWQVARRRAVGRQTLTPGNYGELFQRTQESFQFQIMLSHAAMARFTNAGFTLPLDFKNFAPLLAGDTQKKTYLILQHVADPAIGDNWRYALSAGNLQLEFNDLEAAYQFLSNRRAADTQKR